MKHDLDQDIPPVFDIARSSTDARGRRLLSANDWDRIFKKHGVTAWQDVFAPCLPDPNAWIDAYIARWFAEREAEDRKRRTQVRKQPPCAPVGAMGTFTEPVSRALDVLERNKTRATANLSNVLQKTTLCGQQVYALSGPTLMFAYRYPDVWKCFMTMFGTPGLARMELANARGFRRFEGRDLTKRNIFTGPSKDDFQIDDDTIVFNTVDLPGKPSKPCPSSIKFKDDQGRRVAFLRGGETLAASMCQQARNLHKALMSKEFTDTAKRLDRVMQVGDNPLTGQPGAYRFSRAMWLKTHFLEWTGDLIKEEAALAAIGPIAGFVGKARLVHLADDIHDAAKARRGTRRAVRSAPGGLGRFPEWKVGNPITKLTPEGNYPSWATIRSRYWQNRDPSGFGPSNRAIMRKGYAPKARVIVRDRETRRIYELPNPVMKELHHARGNRGVPGYDTPRDLREVWPWEHEKLLPPGRRLDYDFIRFK